jgi:poly(A) polymerase
MSGQPRRSPVGFSKRLLDRAAIGIVEDLQRAGHETYLVGGCVRDLLLGEQPKDFDVATSARPNQVLRVFRRARVIGRRFKIVHVYRGRDIFEIATFRRTPEGLEGDAESDDVAVIRDDNLFGTSEQDAHRRDFTVNALFLDPVAGEIVDWVGGLDDIEARRLRSIGDPEVRFREDPVRILRLIKFSRRLGLEPMPDEVRAARKFARDLTLSAPARIAEELFRLMRTGQMEGVLDDLKHLDVLDVVLPELAPWLRANPSGYETLKRRLAVFDASVQDGAVPDYALSLALLFGPRAEQEFDPETRTLPVEELSQVPLRLLGEFQARARIPRAAIQGATALLLSQLRLDPPAWMPERLLRRRDPLRIVGQDGFADALECLRCRLEGDGRDLEPYDRWHEWGLAQGLPLR